MQSVKDFQQFINNREGKYLLPSGKFIDFFNMVPDDICIEDIAHALARKCRWNGWTKDFYSIAEHSIHVAAFVPEELKLTALLHDASEAYLFDIPRPVKMRFPQLLVLEDSLTLIIAEKFKLPFPTDRKIADADDYVLEHEFNFVFRTDKLQAMPPDKAEIKFIERFNDYSRFHKPVDWIKDEVDKLKARLDELPFMERLSKEIEKDIKDESYGKGE